MILGGIGEWILGKSYKRFLENTNNLNRKHLPDNDVQYIR